MIGARARPWLHRGLAAIALFFGITAIGFANAGMFHASSGEGERGDLAMAALYAIVVSGAFAVRLPDRLLRRIGLDAEDTRHSATAAIVYPFMAGTLTFAVGTFLARHAMTDLGPPGALLALLLGVLGSSLFTAVHLAVGLGAALATAALNRRGGVATLLLWLGPWLVIAGGMSLALARQHRRRADLAPYGALAVIGALATGIGTAVTVARGTAPEETIDTSTDAVSRENQPIRRARHVRSDRT